MSKKEFSPSNSASNKETVFPSEPQHYPKVLIVGTYFERVSGGGITMSNLFKQWYKENIAVAAERIIGADDEICNNYYQLGFKENKRRFPFNVWQKKEPSGKLHTLPMQAFSAMAPKASKAQQWYNWFLHVSGLYHYTRQLQLSAGFEKWLEHFSPNIIYTQLSSLESIRFVALLHQKYHLPIVLHMMDDWPSTIGKKGWLQLYWTKKIDRAFRDLLDQSQTLLSISEAMSEAYRKRYGKTFLPFHNPIQATRWVSHTKKDYRFEGPFILLYAGRIGTGIEGCLLELATAIADLQLEGLAIELHVQTISNNTVLDQLRPFNCVKIKPPTDYDELPKLFASADVLLLANDFDRKSISFLQFSMPTKASEYMVTGTPILLYAPIETALAQHALRNKWAYVVTAHNKKRLSQAIKELYANEALRQHLGSLAKQYALTHFDDAVVSQQFLKAFLPHQP